MIGVLRFRFAALLAFGFTALLAHAQQFSISPTDSLVSEFPTDSLTRIFQLDFPNETADSLGLTWRWVGGGWSEGWDVNLCDFGECYTGVPSDADMMPMPPDGAAFLKLIVNSLELDGSCFLHFWVWPTGNQDAFVDVYFDLRNGGVNAIEFLEASPAPRAYPNPVISGQTVTLDGLNSPLSPSAVQRFGPDGKFHLCDPSATPSGWTLSTTGWPAGQHWIQWSASRPPVRLIVE